MIGILLITHGQLGQSLLSCAEHILQREMTHIAALEVDKSDDPDVKIQEAQSLLKQLDSGTGVLVLSDICGGTPSNIASRLLTEDGSVQGIAGVSLPMLVRVACYRHLPLGEVLSKAVTGGLEGVIVMDTYTRCGCQSALSSDAPSASC